VSNPVGLEFTGDPMTWQNRKEKNSRYEIYLEILLFDSLSPIILKVVRFLQEIIYILLKLCFGQGNASE